MAGEKQISITQFNTIAEDSRDLPNGSFHYLENVDVGNFGHSAKQIPNVYTKDNDQCILKIIKYGTNVYGLGYENSTTKKVTLYLYDQINNVYNPLTNGTVGSGTIYLYAPFFVIQDGVIYFDAGNGYIANYVISTHTMNATPSGFALTGGLLGGTIWQGNIWGFSNYDHHIYFIDGGTHAALVQKVPISTNQDVVDLIAYGNYLAIIGTASQVSDDGTSRMMLWDGQNLSVTPFSDIVDIGFGTVTGGDILDGLIYVVMGFVNRKGFRIKVYSGGIFQTTYTYFGRKNLVSNYLYCQPASSAKAYTGYLYFMVVGARPGSTYAPVYEMVLFRYGKTNLGQNNKLSVYKTMDVIPGVGNTLTTFGNDFIVSEEISPADNVDNSVYAVVYEASYKTRQVYMAYTPTYGSQPGVVETGIYTGGDSSIKKGISEMSIKCDPLTANQSIKLLYKGDAETAWKEVITINTVGTVSYEPLLEADGSSLSTYKEVSFRFEYLGGAKLTGFSFKFEEETGQRA